MSSRNVREALEELRYGIDTYGPLYPTQREVALAMVDWISENQLVPDYVCVSCDIFTRLRSESDAQARYLTTFPTVPCGIVYAVAMSRDLPQGTIRFTSQDALRGTHPVDTISKG